MALTQFFSLFAIPNNPSNATTTKFGGGCVDTSFSLIASTIATPASATESYVAFGNKYDNVGINADRDYATRNAGGGCSTSELWRQIDA